MNQTDTPRRKRLKVVRACTECRRKKTKCDGEPICAPCLKSHSSCQYTTAKLIQTNNKKTETTIGLVTTSIKAPDENNNTIFTKNNNNNNNGKSRSPSIKKPSITIFTIEQRLSEIEKTLRLLINRHYPSLPPLILSSPSSSTSSSSSSTTLFKEPEIIPDSTGTGVGAIPGISPQIHDTFRNISHHHMAPSSSVSPRATLTLPPLQRRQSITSYYDSSTPTSSSSSSSSTSSSDLLFPYHEGKVLYDRKNPVLVPLSSTSLHQKNNNHTQHFSTSSVADVPDDISSTCFKTEPSSYHLQPIPSACIPQK
ncbi:uncharacterized protein BX664DRAFT_339819 [Halteromyces radiatus]|uniref:uncharacterized protein n=1 Tax=Halteromyces radiatus TaxID=101107 RepID=UPI00221F664D|nr:uncharacterized protein BX664DRAFT_339819 [Halteromyces radiatus]KAI8083101.1 hypothetical protein BX664DRAFT_339819 [Halteromyces radiatus]